MAGGALRAATAGFFSAVRVAIASLSASSPVASGLPRPPPPRGPPPGAGGAGAPPPPRAPRAGESADIGERAVRTQRAVEAEQCQTGGVVALLGPRLAVQQPFHLGRPPPP